MATGKDRLEEMLGDMLGGMAGKNSVKGKRLVKYDKAWIIVAQVTDSLYLAVETNADLPSPLQVVRARPEELITL